MSGLLATRTSRSLSRLSHLRACLPACGVTAVLAGLCGLLAGPGEALGAALGVGLAAATFALGAFVVDRADRRATSLVLPVGLMTYLVTVIALGVLVVRFQSSANVVVRGLPWGVLAGVLTWIPVQAWWAWTSPTPYVVLTEGDEG